MSELRSLSAAVSDPSPSGVAVNDPADRARPFTLTGSPLIASRSLGRLLGLEALSFKIEAWQPTGSWLDRSAAALVAEAQRERRTGLGVVGMDAWVLPLAVQCARAGLRLVMLEPGGGDGRVIGGSPSATETDDRGWLAAFGVRTITVEADRTSVQEVAHGIMGQVGLRMIDRSEPLLGTGYLEVVREVEAAGQIDSLYAVPELTGLEAQWATDAARRSGAAPLPLDDLPPAAGSRPVAIVGRLGQSVQDASPSDHLDEAADQHGAVQIVQVAEREAEAARRLLAGEEGLPVSRRGAAGLAALVRALRDDRSRRPRERRLRQLTTAVVLVTSDPLRAGEGPPLAADTIRRRPVPLATLSANLARLLVEPPGRSGGRLTGQRGG